MQAIDHPADVVGAVDDAVSGDVIDAAEIGGDGGLGFDFGVGTQRDSKELAKLPVGRSAPSAMFEATEMAARRS